MSEQMDEKAQRVDAAANANHGCSCCQTIGVCPACLRRPCACLVDEDAAREFLRGLTTPPGDRA